MFRVFVTVWRNRWSLCSRHRQMVPLGLLLLGRRAYNTVPAPKGYRLCRARFFVEQVPTIGHLHFEERPKISPVAKHGNEAQYDSTIRTVHSDCSHPPMSLGPYRLSFVKQLYREGDRTRRRHEKGYVPASREGESNVIQFTFEVGP